MRWSVPIFLFACLLVAGCGGPSPIGVIESTANVSGYSKNPNTYEYETPVLPQSEIVAAMDKVAPAYGAKPGPEVRIVNAQSELGFQNCLGLGINPETTLWRLTYSAESGSEKVEFLLGPNGRSVQTTKTQ